MAIVGLFALFVPAIRRIDTYDDVAVEASG